jgi:CheY-like chemotaxis protein
MTPPPGPGTRSTTPASPPATLTVTPLSVLVVEDDAMVRAITAEMVREFGHAVIEASSGEAAMAVLPSTPIDVLIADIGLPGMSGDVFAAQVRSLCPKLGIIFVSGAGRLPGSGRDLGEGPVMLRKPYGSLALAKALQEAMKRV